MRRRSRWIGLVALVLVTVSACGTGGGLSRDEARDRWVRTFATRYGILEETAACMVDQFFAELGDAELRPLTNGQELSDAQAERLGELAVACGVGEAAGGVD